jgi:hypothetical protein
VPEKEGTKPRNTWATDTVADAMHRQLSEDMKKLLPDDQERMRELSALMKRYHPDHKAYGHFTTDDRKRSEALIKDPGTDAVVRALLYRFSVMESALDDIVVSVNLLRETVTKLSESHTGIIKRHADMVDIVGSIDIDEIKEELADLRFVVEEMDS